MNQNCDAALGIMSAAFNITVSHRGQLPHRLSKYYFFDRHIGMLSSSEPPRHITPVPPSYQPSITALHDLKKVDISELRIETRHEGRYLLLKVITPPHRLAGIRVVVEDEKQDAMTLTLYQQDDQNLRSAEYILNENMVVVIKEPYFRLDQLFLDGTYGVQVDHVSDIMWLSEDDERVPMDWAPRIRDLDRPAKELKKEGNKAMEQKKYWEAIARYTEAFKCSGTPEEMEVIKRNRALAYLRTHQYEAALKDLSYSLSSKGFSSQLQDQKTLYRTAQALYQLERYHESFDVWTTLLKAYPENTEAQIEFAQTISRLKEQKIGQYDFKQLYKEADELRPPYLDHASYIGPVEVRQTKERGRGLFTTAPVKAGDLLLAEKAFAYSYRGSEEEALRSGGRHSKASVLMYQGTSTIKAGSEASLIKTVVQKLSKNPSLMSTFTDLYHGEYPNVTSIEVDGLPVIDTFLIERIIYLNAFHSPLTSRLEHLTLAAQKPTSTNGENLSSGVWIQASYINHSCISNTLRTYIGNMQFIRASEDLPANTEILHCYQPISDNSKFMKQWGFYCNCPICTDIRMTDAKTLVKRGTLGAGMKALFEKQNGNIAINLSKFDPAKVERDIAEMEKTFTKLAREVPRRILWSPCLALVRVYSVFDRKEKLIWAVSKTLESFGYVVAGISVPGKRGESRELKVEKWGMADDYVVDCWMYLWTAFELLGEIDKGAKARELAKRTYMIVVGEDVTFWKTYEEKGSLCVKQRRLWNRL